MSFYTLVLFFFLLFPFIFIRVFTACSDVSVVTLRIFSLTLII